MSTDLGTDLGTDLTRAVAVRLDEVAGRAEPAPDTADRAVALDRARRRRVLQWAAAALVVVLLAAGAGLSRSVVTEPADSTATAARGVYPRPPMLYTTPVRGSLADDEGFLAEMAGRDWSSPYGDDGAELTPYPTTRRVVYAADVPGGSRWVVVLGRNGVQWLVAWFTGPRDASPDEMTLALPASPFLGSEPLVLMDVSGTTGPVVVLAEPGDGAEYAPGLDRAPDGQLVRDFDPLPMTDGVPVGLVTMPVTWNAAQLFVLHDGERFLTGIQLVTGTPPWAMVSWGPNPPDDAVLAACLTEAGFVVAGDPLRGDVADVGVSWSDPVSGQLTSAEQAVRDRLVDGCYTRATGG